MNHTSWVFFLQSLSRLSELKISDFTGSVVTLKVRRRCHPIFLIVLSELRFEYFFQSLTFLGKCKLIVSKFQDFFNLARPFSLAQLFFPFAVEVPHSSITAPFEIFGVNKSALWISRTAIVEGLLQISESEEIDWDLRRKRDNFRILVFKVKSKCKTNFFLDPSNGIVVKHSNSLLKEDVVPSLLSNTKILHSKLIVKEDRIIYPSPNQGFRYTGWPTYLPYQWEDQVKVIPPVFSRELPSATYFPIQANWYHFLIETMTNLVPFRSQLAQQNFVVPKGIHSQIEEALLLFSPSSFIYSSFLDAIYVRQLTVLGFDESRQIALRDRRDEIMEVRGFVQSNLSLQSHKERPKLYLKRRSDQFRDLVNRKEVEQFLTWLGFLSVDFQEVSFKHQIELVSQASAIVAESGAALTNMIFAPSDCRIFELKPSEGERLFEKLAAVIGLEYHCVETSAVRKGTYNINLNHLRNLLLSVQP